MDRGTPGEKKPVTFEDVKGKLGNKIRDLIKKSREGYWLEDNLIELIEYILNNENAKPENLYIPAVEHKLSVAFALIDNDNIIIRFKDKDSEHYYLLNVYPNPFKPEIIAEITIFDCENAIFQYKWTIKEGESDG